MVTAAKRKICRGFIMIRDVRAAVMIIVIRVPVSQ